ncbi:MAG TPA: hypothetical protein VGI16_08790 [Candidatus Acidoferrum sp.]
MPTFGNRALPIFLSAALLFGATIPAFAQESSSQPQSSPPANQFPVANSPTAALRDALSAACSQSANDFSHFLTVRNAQSFSHLTPGSRVALMKRFVLLNQPGKPAVIVNPSGRPTVSCETPEFKTQMQIGGADIHDNLAFLPLELRDETDTTGQNVQHVTMGLVRENGSWKILSVGLLMLDLPALEIEWDTAEIDSTEHLAIDDIKAIAVAVESYRRTYSRLPDSLSNLGTPPRATTATPDAAGLLDADLTTGAKDGYAFRYVIRGASAVGAPAKYELSATPQVYGRTGRRSFFRDAEGNLRAADHKGAVGSAADPKLP